MVIITHTRRARHGVVLTGQRRASPENASARPTDRGRRGCGVTHWPDLDAARQGRAGWRRVGRADHGPCPVSGAGRAWCCASDGRAGGVALGCRKCGNGGRLERESLMAHLAALGGETARHVAAHATNDRVAIEPPSPLPARAWGGHRPDGGRTLPRGGPWGFRTIFTGPGVYRVRVAFWPVQSSHRVTDTSTEAGSISSAKTRRPSCSLVRLDVDQPARARQGRMGRRRLVQREVQELPDAQRIGRAPRDGPLRVQALKIAEQQQSEIAPRRQTRPPDAVGIELRALCLDEDVEARVVEDAIQLA